MTEPLRTVSDDERRARLGLRHALAPGHRAASAEDAVAAMTCLHATEPASVHLSAWARSGASRDQVHRALHEDRSVVLQLAMRRTVFAFPRDVLPAVLGSASARVAAQLAARLAKEVEQNGLADDGATWVTEACAATLERLREAPATTQALREALPALALRLRISPGKAYGAELPVAPRLLGVLAADGRVVRGRPAAGWRTSRPVWATAEDWLGAAPAPLTATAGYAELVRRSLWSFGPGTEDDLVWWLGATKGAVRRALADVEAVPVLLADGSRAFLRPDDTDEVEAPDPWAALLPALDPTTMGWKGRGFHLGDLGPTLFDRNGNGGPTAWWGGRVVGGWRQEDDGTVVVVPAGTLPRAARRPLADAADRLTAWFDGEVVRTIYHRRWCGPTPQGADGPSARRLRRHAPRGGARSRCREARRWPGDRAAAPSGGACRAGRRGPWDAARGGDARARGDRRGGWRRRDLRSARWPWRGCGG